MAEELAEKPQLLEGDVPAAEEVPAEKRGREEGDEGGGVSKRQKAGESLEEERTDAAEGLYSVAASVGPKVFTSSVEMFDYFLKLLRCWSPNLDINKYEHMLLLDLLKKGHPEPARKIGEGIQAFQVRYHPSWKSRCFFLVRVDGTTDDFSFRKCVDKILPLPDHMKTQSTFDNDGSHRRGGGRRGGRGYGRRGGFRK